MTKLKTIVRRELRELRIPLGLHGYPVALVKECACKLLISYIYMMNIYDVFSSPHVQSYEDHATKATKITGGAYLPVPLGCKFLRQGLPFNYHLSQPILGI